MSKKIGRNEPCPCGSGKKYKRCHGSGNFSPLNADNKTHDLMRQHIEALTKQREQQQGLGRPIVSTEGMGRRFVAVGNRVFHSEKWKTFHDFLLEYPRNIFDTEWAHAEMAKPFETRHPILQWHELLAKYNVDSFESEVGKVQATPMIGAAAAYLHLSYNLYLLAHNAELQRRLVKRLMNPDQFHGAYYETYVFGALIKAGFSIELEDESDGAGDHCECIARYGPSGKSYSVEAKARGVEGVLGKDQYQGAPADGKVKVLNKLRDALGKGSDHERIVFIDTNVPATRDGVEWEPWMDNVLSDLRSSEGNMLVWGQEAPPAYVFVTNYPYHHEPGRDDYKWSVMAEGFKINDFKIGGEFFSLREAVAARDKHKDMYALAESMMSMEIPSTFDGELPEFVFDQEGEPRLLIGHKYLVPNEEGELEAGVLESAAVLENEKQAYGAYQLESGRRVICATPLSDVELAAYRRSPDTFFGVFHPVPKKAEDAIDLYDFFYKTSKKMKKGMMLEHLAGHPKYGEFEGMEQNELAKEYALAFAERAHQQSQKS